MTPSDLQLPRAFAFALALVCGAVLSCGARTSIDDEAFAAAGGAGAGAGPGASAGASTGAGAGVGPIAGCGVACSGNCEGGRCLVTLASNQVNVGCLAVDADSVYWAAAISPSPGGGINRGSLNGGPYSTIAQLPSAPSPCSIVASGQFVYWTDGSSGSLFKARTRGSIVQMLASNVGAEFIAVNATNVYWTGPFGYPTKIPLTGGVATKLADSTGSAGIALDVANLYWSAPTAGIVWKISLDDGAPVPVASRQSQPQSIASDGSDVFWASSGSGAIQTVSHDGGRPVTLAAGQSASVIAVDETSVYWSTPAAGLRKVSKTGGSVVSLAPTAATDIVVDATSVYWTDGVSVLKLTPK